MLTEPCVGFGCRATGIGMGRGGGEALVGRSWDELRLSWMALAALVICSILFWKELEGRSVVLCPASGCGLKGGGK